MKMQTLDEEANSEKKLKVGQNWVCIQDQYSLRHSLLGVRVSLDHQFDQVNISYIL